MKDDIADREAHRKEMMALIAKRMHRKGAQQVLRAAPAQPAPAQHQHPSTDARMESNAVPVGRLESATAAERQRLPKFAGVNNVSVEIDGRTKDIDINACADLHAFYQAVKDKFGQQADPEVCRLHSHAGRCCQSVYQSLYRVVACAGAAIGVQCVWANTGIP